MTVPTPLRLFICAVLLVFLPVNDAQSNSPACGKSTFSDLRGNITSPNYPYLYENNQYCNYVIVAPSLSTINFTFNALDLERSSACSWDWLEFICESNSIRRPVKYCGSGYRAQLSIKPCSRVSVRFFSDGSVTGTGFSVSYSIEPISCQGNCIPVASGAGYNCTCDANQTPYIAPPYNQCPDGCFNSSTYCACNLPPNTPTSPSTTLPPRTPAVHPACGQSTFSGLTGSISSPNYPYNFDNNQYCNYIIEAPALSTINFTFYALGLEETLTCVFDWIRFTCLSNSISRPVMYCGSGYRAPLSFKPCSRVLMTFSSDSSVTDIGFLVSYNIEPIRCQGNCTPVANGAGYNCSCDANQTPYIAPPYNQCPDGCLDDSTYCACSQPFTNTTTSLPSCYECSYSANTINTSDDSPCGRQTNSRQGRVCVGAACQTYSYYSASRFADEYVDQQCVDAYTYEENLSNCRNQSQVYGSNYFFEGDQCCNSYRNFLGEMKSCVCASDYCNNYILQKTVIS